MDKVSILLVENPYFNISKIDSALEEAGIKYSLYFAGSGKNGLDILMGDPYHELVTSEAHKVKPNIVILSKELKDISSLEFLDILGKYYSLRNLKVFLLFDTLSDFERIAYEKRGIKGYLQRPLDKDQIVNTIRPLLTGGKTHYALIPFALLRTKLAKAGLEVFVKSKIVGMGIGAKVAASITSVLMISSVAIYNANNSVNEDLKTGIVKIQKEISEQDRTVDSILPVNTAEPIISKELISRKKVESLETKVIASSLNKDSLEPQPQNSETFSNRIPDDIRIKVTEESDSLPR